MVVDQLMLGAKRLKKNAQDERALNAAFEKQREQYIRELRKLEWERNQE